MIQYITIHPMETNEHHTNSTIPKVINCNTIHLMLFHCATKGLVTDNNITLSKKQ